MRIRKQASKMMMNPRPLPPPPPSSSFVLNPRPSHELIGSKQTEEKDDPMGKESSMEPHICTTEPSESELDAVTEEGKGKGKRSSAAVVSCKRSDGKGWQCKRAAADGSSLCAHHLSLSRGRSSLSSAGIKIDKAKRTAHKKRKEKEEKEKEEAAAAKTVG